MGIIMTEKGRQKHTAKVLDKIVSSLPTDRTYTEAEALLDLAYRHFNHKVSNIELLAVDWGWPEGLVLLFLTGRNISFSTDKMSQWVDSK